MCVRCNGPLGARGIALCDSCMADLGHPVGSRWRDKSVAALHVLLWMVATGTLWLAVTVALWLAVR